MTCTVCGRPRQECKTNPQQQEEIVTEQPEQLGQTPTFQDWLRDTIAKIEAMDNEEDK
jgi:hypothetical protein